MNQEFQDNPWPYLTDVGNFLHVIIYKKNNVININLNKFPLK
jgi:hypothetical protein